jgi:PIN domain nuclease of toxin-antitoxin system
MNFMQAVSTKVNFWETEGQESVKERRADIKLNEENHKTATLYEIIILYVKQNIKLELKYIKN